MTAQIPERLIHQGNELKLCSEPLEQYFQQIGRRPRLPRWHTACCRGYVGTWQVEGGCLYLVELQTRTHSRGLVTNPEAMALLEAANSALGDDQDAALFPNAAFPIFASWYSGTLRCMQGKMLQYVHAGYASVYEQELLIEVCEGRVVDMAVRDNRSLNEMKATSQLLARVV